ncbi:MAG: 50S ribosomal protein L11 methyltransferase [Woeseiaceae bacterium]|nr:50S ribosomal protein L11 methyltransferase [Woeseiaceae bacterium]
MDWRQFVMDLESLNPDRVEEILLRHGAHSVTYSDAGDQPLLEPAPGETPLWRDTRITGLFSVDTDFAALRDEILGSFNMAELPRHEISELEDRPWEREWLRDFGPMRFGERLWICPGDSRVDDEHAVIVRLDPGLAFGTGTHATTALCLEWLDSLALDGRTLLDYGCGSGILAIAALKLGCAGALATDIDHQAITATRDNAAANGVGDRLKTHLGAENIDEQFDVVIANILASPLVELAGPIAARVRSGCPLALSGILSGQVGEVLEAYRPWIEFDEPVEREQGGQTWVRLSGRRTVG